MGLMDFLFLPYILDMIVNVFTHDDNDDDDDENDSIIYPRYYVYRVGYIEKYSFYGESGSLVEFRV